MKNNLQFIKFEKKMTCVVNDINIMSLIASYCDVKTRYILFTNYASLWRVRHTEYYPKYVFEIVSKHLKFFTNIKYPSFINTIKKLKLNTLPNINYDNVVELTYAGYEINMTMPSLEKLIITNCMKFDIKLFPKLKFLDDNYNTIKGFNSSTLEHLYIRNNATLAYENFNLPNLKSLIFCADQVTNHYYNRIDIEYSKFNEMMDKFNAPNLTHIQFGCHFQQTLDNTNFSKLKKLVFGGGYNHKLDLSKFPSLKVLACEGTLSVLNQSYTLKKLMVRYYNFDIYMHFPNLKKLQLKHCNNIDIEKLPSLKLVKIENTAFNIDELRK